MKNAGKYFLCAMLLNLISIAQSKRWIDYNCCVDSGTINYGRKNYKDAIKYFLKADSIYPIYSNNDVKLNYLLLKALRANEQCKQSLRFIKRLVSIPYINCNKVIKELEDDSCISRNELYEVNMVCSINSAKVKFPTIRDSLLLMWERDQEVRGLGHEIPKSDSIRKATDSINQVKLIRFFDKIKCFSLENVGRDGAYAAWGIVQHSNVDLMERFYKTTEKLMKKGLIQKENIALLKDRIIMLKGGKPQLYCTQRVGKAYYPCTLKKLNERREEYNLPPIKISEINFHEKLFPVKNK